MRSWWTSALSVSAVLLVSACAARSARPEHATSAATPTGEQAQQSGSTWREMTWAEYYSDVMERASRRGVTVVWVNPPPVRPAPPTAAQPIDRVTPPPAR